MEVFSIGIQEITFRFFFSHTKSFKKIDIAKKTKTRNNFPVFFLTYKKRPKKSGKLLLAQGYVKTPLIFW